MNSGRTETNRSLIAMLLWSLPALLTVATLIFIFRDALNVMVIWWEEKPEYNHGYLIPFVAAYLLLLRAEAFRKIEATGSWSGLALLSFGLLLLVLGELSAVYVITQYAFLVSLVGLAVIAYGWRGVKVIWAPLAYLFFMIPLPSFLYNNLSSQLQLLSSELGVAVLRLAGVTVFLEGNVIDLGEFQLQVAEACSGLRYLFPLTSFGFLCAFLFRGPIWQKVIIFLSTIPITLLMNSFRIGVIGILVEYYGISMARGFLHDFEGWFIFMACVGILFLEIALFSLLRRRSFTDLFAVDVPPVKDFQVYLAQHKPSPLLIGLPAIVLAVGLVTDAFNDRVEIVPERGELSTFPLVIKEWHGREIGLEKLIIDTLKLDDYVMAQFTRKGDRDPVEFYVAYYNSQRKGASIHSPRACLPGGGWDIEEFDQQLISDVGPDGQSVSVNRVVIGLGSSRQLVYYWFQQRHRNLTNEYLVKWYIFWDALTLNRTDGALVRLVTPVENIDELEDADRRLQQFVRDIDPLLAYYIPREAEGT